MFENNRGGIIITPHISSKLQELKELFYGNRIVVFETDDFKIEDAHGVIAEAYKSEENIKSLILAAQSFTIPAQNALLKILEEPPLRIQFIIIAPNKSTLLPTVRSRLSIYQEQENREYQQIHLLLSKLTLADMFDFIKTNEKLKKHDAKLLIQALMHHALKIEKLSLKQKQLDAFDKAFRLIEVNGRFQTILIMLLNTFLKEGIRVH